MRTTKAIPQPADQRLLGPFAKRRMRQRRSIPIVAAAVIAMAATPLVADPTTEVTEVGEFTAEVTEFDDGNISVMVLTYTATGEYGSTSIGVGLMDLYDGEVAGMHSASGRYSLMFIATTDSRTAEEVVFRVGRMPMVAWPGRWGEDPEVPMFLVPLSSDGFLELLIGGERMTYRMGNDTGILELPIPEQWEDAVAFFRRQVELHGSAEPLTPDQGASGES